jgi:hypothetical protein
MGGADEKNWKELAAESPSFGSQRLTIVRRDAAVPPKGPGLNHIVLFSFAHMLIREAANGKAPEWFMEGFSSLCEYLVLKMPRCYSVRYEHNPLSFEISWEQAVAKAIRAGRVKNWERVFGLDLIGMSVVDYQQCFSMVHYLFVLDPKAFGELVRLMRQGVRSGPALEKAFGKPVAQLEKLWSAWANRG